MTRKCKSEVSFGEVVFDTGTRCLLHSLFVCCHHCCLVIVIWNSVCVPFSSAENEEILCLILSISMHSPLFSTTLSSIHHYHFSQYLNHHHTHRSLDTVVRPRVRQSCLSLAQVILLGISLAGDQDQGGGGLGPSRCVNHGQSCVSCVV